MDNCNIKPAIVHLLGQMEGDSCLIPVLRKAGLMPNIVRVDFTGFLLVWNRWFCETRPGRFLVMEIQS